MRQRPAQAIELPHDQAIALFQIRQAIPQAGSIIPRSLCLVGVKVTLVNARSEQRITLQIDRLAIVSGRHPHVSNQHDDKPQKPRCRTLYRGGRVCRTLSVICARERPISRYLPREGDDKHVFGVR
jgi:hypothetical protein